MTEKYVIDLASGKTAHISIAFFGPNAGKSGTLFDENDPGNGSNGTAFLAFNDRVKDPEGKIWNDSKTHPAQIPVTRVADGSVYTFPVTGPKKLGFHIGRDTGSGGVPTDLAVKTEGTLTCIIGPAPGIAGYTEYGMWTVSLAG